MLQVRFQIIWVVRHQILIRPLRWPKHIRPPRTEMCIKMEAYIKPELDVPKYTEWQLKCKQLKIDEGMQTIGYIWQVICLWMIYFYQYRIHDVYFYFSVPRYNSFDGMFGVCAVSVTSARYYEDSRCTVSTPYRTATTDRNHAGEHTFKYTL